MSGSKSKESLAETEKIDVNATEDLIESTEFSEAESPTEIEQKEAVVDSETELAVAQEEIAKLKDAFLRAKAEEDNIRRRSEKEVANSRKYALEGFAKEMLNVYDSLKLACSVELDDASDDTVKRIHEGVEITLKQLNSAFAKFSLTEVTPKAGDKLDPNLHQAMSLIESDEVDSGCIINVIQAGFQLHDRLLRPAMVVVAK